MRPQFRRFLFAPRGPGRRRDGRLQIEERSYWYMPFPQEAARGEMQPEEHYIDEVRARLVEAVQLRLEADVPVGCYLSGGIDSCAIVGLSAASTQGSVKAFTIGFDSKDYDETPIATEMAESVGAEQDILRIGQDVTGVENSIAVVKQAGVTPVIAHYTPIPHTPMWDDAVAASRYDLAADPIFTNNAIFPCQSENFSWKVLTRLKNLARA